MVEQVRALAREIVDAKLPICPNCAARTVIADIEPIVQIARRSASPIEAATFIGSSPIRQYAEDWTLERMLQVTEEAVSFAVQQGLPVMYVTEDTTRAKPETLKPLYGTAIRCGARRICLADTVGHATPDGVRSLVHFVQEEIVEPSGEDVKIDWHGHRDRGLGIINCLAAIEAGVDRVHATALGRGRAGRQRRDGSADRQPEAARLHTADLSKLPEYCRTWPPRRPACPFPPNYPVMGSDAFRTGTGVHAAAIIKARKKGDAWLADRVYSSVPAGEFGLAQLIEISPLSGALQREVLAAGARLRPGRRRAAEALFDAAKRSDHTLADESATSCCGSAHGAVDVGH